MDRESTYRYEAKKTPAAWPEANGGAELHGDDGKRGGASYMNAATTPQMTNVDRTHIASGINASRAG
jgi:hypothetical protein